MTVPPRFLHISFKWSGVPKTLELEPLFNAALDWARYAPNCWVLWSNTGIEEWRDHIKRYLSPQDSVFICEINLSKANETYTGLWDKWFWDWVQKKR